ncbi:MAG: ABC transporter substrate-binding protein [Alphaproteobacteria bacterium]|nr:ABC transporter substrate-binding protein [Alphaproteobacteria bacterium]
MRRRDLLGGTAAGMLVGSGAARGADPARIAVVLSGTPQTHDIFLAAFRRGLVQVRLVEGQDVVLAPHYLQGDFSRLPALAATIIGSQTRVVVAASSGTIAGLRRTATSIPMVMAAGSDPIGAGVAASLARPGGNVTGITSQYVDLVEKQFGFLPEMLPGLRRVLGLRGANAPNSGRREDEFLRVAARLAIAADVVALPDHPDFGELRAGVAAQRPDAIFVFSDPVTLTHHGAIMAIAHAARIPVVAPFREFAQAGALMSYGASLVAGWERAAWFVDRILKGANPAEMPIEQPTRFELVINMKTARALGLSIPASALAGADEVIE